MLIKRIMRIGAVDGDRRHTVHNVQQNNIIAHNILSFYMRNTP